MIRRITLTSILLLAVSWMFAVQRDFKNEAIAYIKQNPKQFNLTSQDIADLKLIDQYTDDIDITHVWLQQSVNGILFDGGVVGVHLNAAGKVAFAGGSPVYDLKSKVNTTAASVPMKSALLIAAKLMSGKDFAISKKLENSKYGKVVFDKIEGLTNDPITVTPQYYTLADNSVKLGWEVYIETPSHSNGWVYQLDAVTGKVINKLDNVVHCSFDRKNIQNISRDNTAIANNTAARTGGNSQANSIAAASTFNVYKYSTEAPNFGARQIITDPADPTASPFGWNDTNGAAGAETTTTTGNNVDAYTDKNGDDNPDNPNLRPNAGASLNFDFPLDLTKRTDTLANVSAVLTQLYYMNNIMHDFSYQYGFTEAARNYQKNNYGHGGTAGDYVKAEALDGSGVDNANFSQTTDGTSGRMQMYLWDAQGIEYNLINAPAAIKDTIRKYGVASSNPCNFNVTGSCVVANDGSANPSYACVSPLVNAAAINGKIAIVDRYNGSSGNSCTFEEKILACQDAGAIGVIVVNRVDSTNIIMSIADPELVNIPAIIITKSLGATLKANIANGLNVTLYKSSDCLKLNGALDNAVMAHEYGHGISGRSVGTGVATTCLSNAEQAGEGWSDFFGLALTQKPTDTKNTARGIGTYVIGEPSTGPGIRIFPYSYDLSIDPWSYEDLDSIPDVNNAFVLGPEVHTMGEIMCSTLWDMYWNLIDKYGYTTNVYAGPTAAFGNTKAIALVVKGLQLTVCKPGFIDFRTAVLKADSILYNKANDCEIWSAFARRGMGYSAKQGLSTNGRDQTAAYDLPPSCNLTLVPKFGVNKTTACVGETLTFKDSTTGSPTGWLWRFGDGTTSTSQNPTKVYNAAGVYTVRLIVSNASSSDSVTKVSLITINALPATNITNSDTSICTGASVQLNATGATSYSWSSGQIVSPITVSPTVLTKYVVTGTTNGCSAKDSVTITVKALPTVGVNSPTICSGTSATLTATGNASSFTWSGGLSSGNPTSTGPLTGNATYTVTGTLNGCTNTAVSTVTVTALPTVGVTASTSICNGDSITLTATGATTYTWQPSGSGASIKVAPSGTTTYTVTGTTNGCSNTAATTITVKSKPTVGVNSPTICSGTSATLTATGNATSFTWSGGLAAGNPASTGPLTGNATYTVTGTLNGCTNTAVSTVTVNALPSVAVNSPSICSGGTATLTATGANTYVWSTSATGPSINVSPSATTTYTVTGTSTATTCSKTVTATVTVNNSAPTVTITPSPASVCNGDAVVLTANGANTYIWDHAGTTTTNTLTFVPTGAVTVGVSGTVTGCTAAGTASVNVTVKPKPTVGVNSPSVCSGTPATLTATGADSYVWSTTATGPSISVSPSGTTTYTVTGTTNGCTGTANSTVTVKPLPNTTLNASDNSVCSGDPVTLTASGATTYVWAPGGSGTSQVINPTSTVTYTVTGTTDGCDKSASQTITVSSVPATPAITQSGDTLYSSVIVAGATYNWYLNGSVTPAASTLTPYYHLATAGSYTLQIVINDCSSTSSAAFGAIFTGIKNASNSIKVLEVYPNPTDGKLTINLNLYKNASVQMLIYTTEGRELYSKSYTNTRTVFEELNLNDYAKGVYIIKLKVDNETYYHKVVKE